VAEPEAVVRAAHGGLPLAELEQLAIEPASVLDLSTTLSPLPAHPSVVRAVRACDVHNYPDPQCALAKQAIAHAMQLDPTRLVLGHGSVELLWSLVRVLADGAEPGKPLLLVSPTFSEPEAAARAHGLPVAHVEMAEDSGFAIDAQRIANAIARHAPFAVYMCQPNNPTGSALPRAQLCDLIERHSHLPFIVDEAFLSLSLLHADAFSALPLNAIRVRSLTKDHGLAGLRVGYAVCAPELGDQLERERPPWMISAPSQAAVIATMAQVDHVANVRAELLQHKALLVAELEELGITTVPSRATFFLARVGDGDALRTRLLREHAVLVRSGSTFGLPSFIRLPACLPAARSKLVGALVDTLQERR